MDNSNIEYKNVEVEVEEEAKVFPRLGRIFVKEDTWNQKNCAALFKKMVPTRIEFLWRGFSGVFEVFGQSEFFDEIDDTEARDSSFFPIYDVYIEDDEVFFERVLDEETIEEDV